jgi:hypothetical protein
MFTQNLELVHHIKEKLRRDLIKAFELTEEEVRVFLVSLPYKKMKKYLIKVNRLASFLQLNVSFGIKMFLKFNFPYLKDSKACHNFCHVAD